MAASASQATAAHEECLEAVVRGCLLRGRGGALRRADDLRRASCDFAAFLQQRLAPFYATLAESTPSGIGPPTPPPPPPPRPQTDSPSAEAHGGHALPPKNAERACCQCAVRFLYERPAGAPRRIEGALSASCTQQAINRERLPRLRIFVSLAITIRLSDACSSCGCGEANSDCSASGSK